MASSPSDAYSSRSSASPLTTAQKAALPLFLSSTAEGAKLLRDIAEEAADEALDGLPMDESRRRKNKPGAALYDACDPVRTLRAHEVVEGLGEDEVPRRLTWSADGKICITVGDFGVVGVYGL